MTKKKQIGLIVLIVVLALPLWGRYVWWGHDSPETLDRRHLPIYRRHYPLRHWSWSGIFPLEGGFIPDPHFLLSEPMPFPDPALRVVSQQVIQFRLVDINPFFDDQSSEILLVITSDDSTLEYSLQFPTKQGVQAILSIPDLPNARIVPYEGQLALFANFHGPAKGIYLIPLPMRSGDKLSLISTNDPQFDKIANQLRAVGQDSSIRDQFCRTSRNDFIAFYQKYCGPCEAGSTMDSQVATEENFNRFWKPTK
jgi:hypothetical protein